MERRAFGFELKTRADSGQGIIQAYASTFNTVDTYGTQFMPGCFRETLVDDLDQIKVLWNHNSDEPIAKLLTAYEDGKGLFVEFKVSLGVQRAKDVYTLIIDQVINAMSFGFEILDYHVTDDQVLIDKVRLWEVSPVTFPANAKAAIIGARHALLDANKSDQEISGILNSMGFEFRKALKLNN